MPLVITISPGVIFDNTQKMERIIGQLTVTGTGSYPVGGLALDQVLLALAEVKTNSGIRRCTLESVLGTGYIYQRVQGASPNQATQGTMMILQIPPNGSLTTAAPLQQIPSSLNMQGVQNDIIEFMAEVFRNA